MPGFDSPVLKKKPTAKDFMKELRRQMQEELDKLEEPLGSTDKTSNVDKTAVSRRTGGER